MIKEKTKFKTILKILGTDLTYENCTNSIFKPKEDYNRTNTPCQSDTKIVFKDFNNFITNNN